MALAETEAVADDLLSRVNTLDAISRDSHVARSARDLASTKPDVLTPLLSALERRGPYEQRIAALIARVTQNADWVVAHLADPNPSIQRRALQAATNRRDIVSDDALEAALHDASQHARQAIYLSLRGRPELADRLLVSVRATWGDADAARVLPFCSSDIVASNLPDLLYTVSSWRRLVKLHPRATLRALQDHFQQGTLDSDAWWHQYGRAIAVYPWRNHPEGLGLVFDLLESVTQTWNRDYISVLLPMLAKADPGRTLRMFSLASMAHTFSDAAGKKVRRILARSGVPELGFFLHYSFPHILSSYLRSQPPKLRAATLRATQVSKTPSKIDFVVLDALPGKDAVPIAERALLDITEQDLDFDWEHKLTLRSYLPYDKVHDTLLEATRRSNAQERETGWRLLIDNVRRTRDPVVLESTVDMMVQRLRNEQSPVRSAAFLALAQVPAVMWSTEAASHLVQLVTNSVQSRDFSKSPPISTLTVRMLRDPRLATTGMSILVVMYKHTDSFHCDLSRLSLAVAQRIYDTLVDLLDVDADRGTYTLLHRLVSQLDRRAADIPSLQARLRQAIEKCDNDDYVKYAIKSWLEPRATRVARAVEAFNLDPSTAGLHCVAAVIANCRTDLLSQALQLTEGRFIEPDWYFKADRRSTSRWTPAQCGEYQAHLGRFLNATTNGKSTWQVWQRVPALKAAARVPYDSGFMDAFVADEDVSIREAALTTLGFRPQEIPRLLSLASSDDARVAMFVASQAAQYARPSALEPLLLPVLRDPKAKITSKKEIVRMIAKYLPPDVAASALFPVFQDPETHKDIRVTIVQSTIAHLLSIPQAWQVIDAATSSTYIESQRALLVGVDNVPHSHRQRYGSYVADIACSTDDDTAALALNLLKSWLPYAPDCLQALSSAAVDMTRVSKLVWQAAADSLISSSTRLDTLAALKGVVSQLNISPEPESRLDLPMRRRVVYITTNMSLLKSKDSRHAKQAIGRLVTRNIDTLPNGTRLMASAPGQEPSLDGLQEVAELCENRPIIASQCGEWVVHSFGPTLPSGLLDIVERLIPLTPVAGALIALEIVETALRTGKASKWHGVVKKLRQHSDPTVRIAAMDMELDLEVESDV